MKTIKKIEKWAEDRNFFGKDGATPEMQFKKLVEEVGELAKHLVRGQDVKDDIGDIAVVLIIMNRIYYGNREIETQPWFTFGDDVHSLFNNLMYRVGAIAAFLLEEAEEQGNQIDTMFTILSEIAELQNTTLGECIDVAYSNIKDRKGQWVNGAFIKASDIKIKEKPQKDGNKKTYVYEDIEVSASQRIVAWGMIRNICLERGLSAPLMSKIKCV